MAAKSAAKSTCRAARAVILIGGPRPTVTVPSELKSVFIRLHAAVPASGVVCPFSPET